MISRECTTNAPARRSAHRCVGALLVALLMCASSCSWSGEEPPEPPAEDNEAKPRAATDGAELPRMRSAEELDTPDPLGEGWQSEALAGQVTRQLKRIAELISQRADIQPSQLDGLAAPDFTCGALRPERLGEVFRDATLSVAPGDEKRDGAATYRGLNGLARTLRELNGPFTAADDVRAKFKLVGVEITRAQIITTACYEASGNDTKESLQQNARWRCRWTRDDSLPRLVSIDMDRFEEVTARAPAGALFADCTESVFAAVPAYREQLVWGIDYWQARVARRLHIFQFGQQGLAVGDVNDDGLDDVYLCQPGGLPNRLLLHQPDGTVRDASANAGVDALDFSRSALIVDLDNDGRQDLIVSTADTLLVFAGDGSGAFALKASIADGRAMFSLAAADFDGDDDLDLYACN